MDGTPEILGQLMSHLGELIVRIDALQNDGWLLRHKHYKDQKQTHRNTHHLIDQYNYTLQEIELWKDIAK